MRWYTGLVAGGMLACGASVVSAQVSRWPAPPGWEVAAARQCAAVAAQFGAGPVAPDDPAWEADSWCPGAGPRLAALLRAQRAVLDTGPLRPVLTAAPVLRDADLFAAALEVAGDVGASAPARAASLVVVANALTGGRVAIRYADIVALAAAPHGTVHDAQTGQVVGTSDRGGALPIADHYRGQHGDRPLPADAAIRAAAVVAAAADPRAPALVRAAARCVRGAVSTAG